MVGLFQETIDRIVVLADFIPVLSGQSGNTGSQALAVALRGMTLGDLGKGGERTLIVKEGLSGLLNGLLTGLSAGIGMWLYAHFQGQPDALILGLVVWIAMAAELRRQRSRRIPHSPRPAAIRCRPRDRLGHFPDDGDGRDQHRRLSRAGCVDGGMSGRDEGIAGRRNSPYDRNNPTPPMKAVIFSLTVATVSSVILHAEPSPEAKALAAKAIDAAGGDAKLLRVFRMKERFNAGPELADPAKAGKRESFVEAPKYWWLGGKDRDGEPAKFDVWAWTLVALTDPKTVIESLPGVEENGKTTLALRLTGTIDPALDLHFDPATHRLVRMDWRNDIYRFSDWRELDGAGYHAKTVMHKHKSNEPWFFHEILEIERLAEAPAGLPR